MTKQLRQVFLIRHPKPDIAPGICYGSSDVEPKTAALQTAFLWLDGLLPKDAQIFSSPLTRCARLASLLQTTKARTCKLDPRIAERCCGEWELQPWDQVPRAQLDAWVADFMDYYAPGAESVRQMQARVLAAWHEYMQNADQQVTVLITHAGPIQVLLAHVTGVGFCAQPIAEIACGAVILLTQQQNNATFWNFQVLN